MHSSTEIIWIIRKLDKKCMKAKFKKKKDWFLLLGCWSKLLPIECESEKHLSKGYPPHQHSNNPVLQPKYIPPQEKGYGCQWVHWQHDNALLRMKISDDESDAPGGHCPLSCEPKVTVQRMWHCGHQQQGANQRPTVRKAGFTNMNAVKWWRVFRK